MHDKTQSLKRVAPGQPLAPRCEVTIAAVRHRAGVREFIEIDRTQIPITHNSSSYRLRTEIRISTNTQTPQWIVSPRARGKKAPSSVKQYI